MSHFLALLCHSLECRARHWRNRVWLALHRPLFRAVGPGCTIDASGDYRYAGLEIGADVHIGPGARLWAVQSVIRIGDKATLGPGVTILGGDHNWRKVGQFLHDVRDKDPSDDQDVTVGSDAWLGAQTVVLKGVEIGRGAIVGAGSVVTRSVPPYAIAVGNPCRVRRFRFTVEQILEHEKALYPPAERLTEAQVRAYVQPGQAEPPRE
jgi:acetyltransferase-like isoleucine patch superfamily enzyme